MFHFLRLELRAEILKSVVVNIFCGDIRSQAFADYRNMCENDQALDEKHMLSSVITRQI
jgi:hypothetical protein